MPPELLHNVFMCPVCKKPMVVFEWEGVEIDHCPSCGGTWLDGGELEQIAGREGVPPGRITAALRDAKGEKHGGRRCPRCTARLRSVAVHEVTIDRCPRRHGLWFDPGEMRALLRSFKEGEEGAASRFLVEFFRAETTGKGG